MQDASSVVTKKIYYDDAYQSSFDAAVISAELIREPGGLLMDVVLDRTCFFPEEGGQCADKGILGGFPVADVIIRGGAIHHIVLIPGESESAAFTEGASVHGELDWDFRFSNMQHHSGEHLVSGIVNRMLGLENVGFHLSENEVTMDYSGVIPVEKLAEIERAANEAVWKNIESKVVISAPADREGLSYRSKLELPGEVRIVTFPGVDSCACCAPHVRRTGEIGLIKITGCIRWKGGVRIGIVCGDRALAYFDRIHGIVTETAGFLTTSYEQLLPQAVKMKDEIRELKAALKAASVRRLMDRVEALPEGGEDEDAFIFMDGVDIPACREAVKAMMEKRSGYCGVFGGPDGSGNGYSFVIGSREKDCREACKALREAAGARGGGKADMVQGQVFGTREEILGALGDEM